MLIAVSVSGEGYAACEGEANKECEAKMLTGCVCYFCRQHNMNFRVLKFTRQHNLRWSLAQITAAIHVSMCLCARPARKRWCTGLPCDLGGSYNTFGIVLPKSDVNC